jgi:hypothetical protein
LSRGLRVTARTLSNAETQNEHREEG